MTVMQSEPQVREGQAGGRRCGDNTHPPCQNISQEHATKPSLGGHLSCAKVITVTHVQNQQVNPSSTTTAPQPQWSCGRVANTENQRAYGQCIQSNPCCIVDRQDNQLNFMLSCCQKQLSSNLLEQKMLCAELSSCCQKQLSLRLFEQRMSCADPESCFQKQLSSKVFQQKILCADFSSLLNESLSECTERENSVNKVMTDRGMTAKIQTKLLQQNPSVCEGKASAWPIRLGGKQLCHATVMSLDSESGTKGGVESKWSSTIGHNQVQMIGNNTPSGHDRTTLMTWSGSERGQLGLSERERCSWQGMTTADFSVIQARHTTPATLNPVGATFDSTIAMTASGSDFPHLVLLDFAQDLALGREGMGRSRPASAPIQHGWSLDRCPVLLDSGACVPMPFLISKDFLERSCRVHLLSPLQ